MNTPDIHHLAAAYALDAVDELERRAFEAHYHQCDVCRSDVRDHRETLATLAAASSVAPAAAVKDRVLAEIASTRQLSPLLPVEVNGLAERRRRRAATALLAAAAAVLMFAAGAILVTRDGSPTFSDQLAAVLDEPDGRVLALEATAAGDGAGVVRVAWSPSTGRAVVLGDGLAPAPAGQAYELWLIDASGPLPMRLLDAADDGRFRGAFDIDAAPAAWGVTVEPAAGSDAPTGEILFLAES